VRIVAKLLTGIPSIICGVFAFAVVVSTTGRFSAFAGGVALAVLMLPTILLTSEQALMGVQSAFREASYGLGATKFQTIVRIVLPDALPAIMTGIMLAVARAAGETAPLIFTALFSQFWAKSLSEPTASLSVLIYNFSTVPFPDDIQMAWTASLVLVAFVTLANITAQLVFSKHISPQPRCIESDWTMTEDAARSSATQTPGRPDFLTVRNFDFFYGKKQALFDINMDIPEKRVTAFIGPSGCGKSTCSGTSTG